MSTYTAKIRVEASSTSMDHNLIVRVAKALASLCILAWAFTAAVPKSRTLTRLPFFLKLQRMFWSTQLSVICTVRQPMFPKPEIVLTTIILEAWHNRSFDVSMPCRVDLSSVDFMSVMPHYNEETRKAFKKLRTIAWRFIVIKEEIL